MSVAMDRAMMALSLEEEEVSDLPGVSSAEENELNAKEMAKEGRVRGIALSQEYFQFIFKNEHDLMDVLEKGVQTFNEWVIVLERWVENPPEDYLQFIPLWVQMRNIPVNYYTTVALEALGDIVGKVKVVAFDPTKPITQDYIIVLVRFNVANPLRTSTVIDLGGGKFTVIRFSYEKVQKRCYHCQRLNHEKPVCPILVRQRQEEAQLRRSRVQEELALKKQVLQEHNPLFGVLLESQLGINPLNGRPKIAEEVLQEMRRYLVANTGEDLAIKIDKVIKSVKEAEKDPEVQRTCLRLEEAPEITKDLNRGKGLVFDYSQKVDDQKKQLSIFKPKKLMAEIKLYSSPKLPGTSRPGVSGIVRKRNNTRRRPSKSARKPRKGGATNEVMADYTAQREGKQTMGKIRERMKIRERKEGQNQRRAAFR
ncbi:uncharacterized protein LOC125592522 [Brassica napus]|uniref:uncharacterized protein LOC125592522 n=1 Tax=Brassica napus TaxID=3708 RepID=UPI0020798F3D|nr:uncharacterized protein LOC125592522 [Brassica napus]